MNQPPDNPDPEPELDQVLLALDAVIAGERPAASLANQELDSLRAKHAEVEVLELLQQYRQETRPARDQPFIPAKIGRYEVIRPLGQGGFGVVFLANDPVLKRQVALKLPQPHVLFNPLARRQFLREARSAATLDHPNLVRIYEAGEVGPLCYITSAYIEGQSLQIWLRQHGPAPARLATEMMAALASAVHYAHEQGVLHCDLTPANILVTGGKADSQPIVPHITDFGMARLVNDTVEQATSCMLGGTPMYMAPEVLRGEKARISRATDVFGLGAIFYEMLCGRPPRFDLSATAIVPSMLHERPVTPRKLNPKVPRDLEAVCLKCLEDSPRDRFQTAAQLAEELVRFQSGASTRTRPRNLWQKGWAFFTRGERIAQGGGVAIALSSMLLFWCLAMLVVLNTEMFPVQGARQAMRYGAANAVIYGLIICLGMRMRAESLWACWCAFLCSAGYVTLGIASVFANLQPEMGGLNDSSPTRFMADCFFLLCFVVLFVACLSALLACYAKRGRMRTERSLPSVEPVAPANSTR